MCVHNWQPPDQPSAARYPLKKWLLIKYLLVSIISESESRAARRQAPASSGTWAAANSKHDHGIYSGIISRQYCTDLGGNQSCCQSQREMREVWIWVYAPLQNKISNVLNAAPTHQHPMAGMIVTGHSTEPLEPGTGSGMVFVSCCLLSAAQPA